MEDCRVFAIQLLNVFGKSNERVNENAFANIGNVKAFFLNVQAFSYLFQGVWAYMEAY